LENYSWEQLGPRLQIAVSPEHKFGTDAFLLSDFAQVKRKDMTLDLGCGCGIIPLLWFRQPEEGPRQAWALDIQPQAIDQLQQTVARCGLEGRVIPLCQDLTELDPATLPLGSFTLVTCNPPYKAPGSGILNEQEAHSIARHELRCTLDDVCAAAGRLLQSGGKFCLCQRPERLADALEALRAHKLEPKRLRFVQKRGDCAPWLFLLEARKGGRPFLQVEAPLLIQDEAGDFSPELKRIYRLA